MTRALGLKRGYVSPDPSESIVMIPIRARMAAAEHSYVTGNPYFYLIEK